jgi:hypothetical protein
MLIKAYGLFWQADEIDWNPGSGRRGGFRLLGRVGRNVGTVRVADFRAQQGLYILYGNYGPYYVGLVREQALGKRLKDHQRDHHAGNWDRFSWFGFRSVLDASDPDGVKRLRARAVLSIGSSNEAIGDIEALLIRALGLPSNRAQMRFRDAVQWEQVKHYEVAEYLQKLTPVRPARR